MSICFRAVLITALTPFATAALTLEEAPSCYTPYGSSQMIAARDLAKVRTNEDHFGSYPSRQANGFVAWYGLVEGGTREGLVLLHCPTGRNLSITLNDDFDTANVMQDRFADMMYEDTPYTMKQIGAEMTKLGGKAQILKKNPYGSCACDVAYAGN